MTTIKYNDSVEKDLQQKKLILDKTQPLTGNIFIDKKEASITMENLTAEYTPLGIIPRAFCENSEIEIAYTAFVMDKEGTVTTEEASIPLKQWGKYSVIAYPKDTEHYKRTYAYATIEITPSTPEINVIQTEFIYDGTKKEVGFEVSPKDVLYSTEYYEWEERESKIPIGSAPSRVGKYMVVITAYDKTTGLAIADVMCRQDEDITKEVESCYPNQENSEELTH